MVKNRWEAGILRRWHSMGRALILLRLNKHMFTIDYFILGISLAVSKVQVPPHRVRHLRMPIGWLSGGGFVEIFEVTFVAYLCNLVAEDTACCNHTLARTGMALRG